jgi:hypothetical protein
MSSRVRLMLQDFANNTSHTGNSAFAVLKALYEDWTALVAKPRKSSEALMKRVSDKNAAAHPYIVQMFERQPVGIKPSSIKWEGPGYYMTTVVTTEHEAQPPPPLPKGPKWHVALEMWERLAATHNERFRLFVSRDNRKQVWRRSLCNPFFQGWGFKSRALKPKAVKKAKPLPAATRGGIEYWTDLVDRTANLYAAAGEAAPVAGRAQTPAPAKPPKPRVGIWI